MESTIDQIRALDGMPPVAQPAQAPPAQAIPVAPAVETPAPAEVPVAATPVETPVAPPVAPIVQPDNFELAELRNKLAQYEAKANLSPFASDLVKRVNDIAASGASLNEIQRFIEIQSIDVTGLDDETAIKAAWKLENPAFNDQEIDALYQDRFGADEDDSNAVLLASARRKGEALGARTKLAEAKVNSVPEGVRQQELQAAKFEQAKTAWAPVVTGLGSSLDMSVNDEGVEVPFRYNVPDAILTEARAKATEWAASNQVPFTQEGAKQIEAFIELSVWAAKGAEIKKALVRNAYELGTKAVKVAVSGPPVVNAQFQPPGGQVSIIDQIKALDMQVSH